MKLPGRTAAAGLLVLLLVAPLLIGFSSAQAQTARFPDVSADHRFAAEISMLQNRGIVDGYEDGLFHPERLVKRMQFAKIIVLSLGLHDEAVEPAIPDFPDVTREMGVVYPYDYIQEAVRHNLFQGRENGLFDPYGDMLRVHLALVLYRAVGDALEMPPAGYSTGFTDIQRLSAEAQAAVTSMKFNGVIDGKTSNSFDPWSSATRGHVAAMVARFLALMDDQNGGGGGTGDPHEVALATGCGSCHLGDLRQEHARPSSSVADDRCGACHITLTDAVDAPVSCEDCHGQTLGGVTIPAAHGGIAGAHTSGQDTCVGSSCHDANLTGLHPSCDTCHGTDRVPQTTDCIQCHGGLEQVHPGGAVGDHLLDNPGIGDCSVCHSPDLVTEHVTQDTLDCASCHSGPAAVQQVIDTFGGSNPANPECQDCHPSFHTNLGAAHTAEDGTLASALCSSCHALDISVEHARASSSLGAAGCAGCHPLPAGFTWTGNCTDCHGMTFAGNPVPAPHQGFSGTHNVSGSCVGSGCHASSATAIHPSCATCHSTSSVPTSLDCVTCHTNPHVVSGEVAACAVCHDFSNVQSGQHEAHVNRTDCATCHGLNAPGCLTCHANDVGPNHPEGD